MGDYNFVALDFETASVAKSSICEVGIAVVKNSKIVETRSWLIQPKDNFYHWMNVHIHGITPEMTQNSPSFKSVWLELSNYLSGNNVVAHNTAFDMYALKDALQENDLEFASFNFYCSMRMAKIFFKQSASHRLPDMCQLLQIDFPHHHRAKGDAIGCALVFIKILEYAGINSIDEIAEKIGYHKGCFRPGYFHPFVKDRSSYYLNNFE